MDKSLAGMLLRSTVRIECDNGSCGTGFFFYFTLPEDTDWNPKEPSRVYIVTNNHVANGAKTIKFCLPKCDKTWTPIPGMYAKIELQITPNKIISHPDKTVDLCLIATTDIDRQLHEQDILSQVTAIDMTHIPTPEDLENISAIEDIYMVGYPIALWDPYNVLPLARKGVTATPYKYDFNGKKEFLVDISVFEGSSGSPVVIMDIDKSGARPRRFLLGIIRRTLSSCVNNEKIDLGLVIKSSELLKFIPLIEHRKELEKV